MTHSDELALTEFRAEVCAALMPWEGAYKGYGKDMDEAEAAIRKAAESYANSRVVAELEAAADRFDDEVFRHWGVHGDHDEKREDIFRLAALREGKSK